MIDPQHFKFAWFERMLWTKNQKIRIQKIAKIEPTLKFNNFRGCNFSTFFSIICPRSTRRKIAQYVETFSYVGMFNTMNFAYYICLWVLQDVSEDPVYCRDFLSFATLIVTFQAADFIHCFWARFEHKILFYEDSRNLSVTKRYDTFTFYFFKLVKKDAFKNIEFI